VHGVVPDCRLHKELPHFVLLGRQWSRNCLCGLLLTGCVHNLLNTYDGLPSRQRL